MDNKTASEEFLRKESKSGFEEDLTTEPEFKESGFEEDVAAESEFKKSDRTEYDAVHPRFRQPKKQEEIESIQIQQDYYCEQCKLFFAPDVDGLKTHFREDMVRHRPIDDCFYCKGPVYAYSFNKERKIYHNCRDDQT